MATVVICDRCRTLGEKAHVVECFINKEEVDGRGRPKQRTLIKPRFELCEECITNFLSAFGKWQNRWLVVHEEETNQPVDPTEQEANQYSEDPEAGQMSDSNW